MSHTTQTRRNAVLRILRERRQLEIKDLALEFQVSEATARRDLKALAESKDIELVFGGAKLAHSFDYSFDSKEARNIEAKTAIGQLAAEWVGSHEQIFLDSGTTCFQMAFFLKEKMNLIVISNSLRLAMELKVPGLSVVLLGGQYRPARMDSVGPLALTTLENLHGYLAFIGADGLSRGNGLSASDIESAHLHTRVVAQARETILLADHTKFLSPSLCTIAGWETVRAVITDQRPSDEWTEFFEENSIEAVWPEKV